MGRRGRTGALDIEVVDVELRSGICRPRCSECSGDVPATECIEENVAPE